MQLRDAADTLGVHYQTAYGWVRQGTLPARKTPRGYEVSEGDVRDLMARRAAGVSRRRRSRSGTGPRRPTGCTRRWRPGTRRWRGRTSTGWRRARPSSGCATRSSRRPCAGSARPGRPASCRSPRSTARPRSARGSSPPGPASRRAARGASR